ncbi:MAG: hypothetical protein COX57_09185 [Alphaproteobacteria bacterium CG_4_10_14_0_2_um_filter_63_37]|nr:MAG: hypothetical protein AUJ55_09090 [Proteobacteria bacterium CG1_02_64_396]PJA24334.1 MAG: hypothetical protein COX57_09185 [Alphaproteobacteria bacterium CG_4_10_14_0_2_um_filter_63_37]
MDGPLWGLFASALISSTLLPGGSEALLAYLAHTGEHPLPWLVAVATVGNTLGATITFGMGWWIARRWPVEAWNEPKRAAALERVRRWGAPVLVLSWLPVVGDPLCLAAGWLRLHPLSALIWIAAGKTARYAVVAYAAG